MSNPLSKESESKVISAVHNICESVSEQPKTAEAVNAAAIKAARDNGFGPDMIRFMCAGYNTGATTWQRDNNSDILSKHAEFPLADADAVIAAVYPQTSAAKRASAMPQDVSEEYSRPIRNLATELSPAMSKAAESATVPLVPSEEVKGDDYAALGRANQLQKEIKAARMDMLRAQEDLMATVSCLSRYFKQASLDRRWSFGEVKFAAEKRFGKIGELVMQAVAATNGYTVDTTTVPKRAVNWNAAPFDILDQCVKVAFSVERLRDEHIKVAVGNREKIAKLMAPYRAPAPTQPRQILKVALSPLAMNTAVISGSLKNLLGDYIKPTSTSSLVQGKLDDLSDPEHEEELRRIRSQSMLQGLLTDDPVVSGYDPNEVMRAYNELNSLSPRSAQQPAVARSVLRKWMTQGTIEPFEAKEVTDLEKNLIATQGRSQSGSRPEPAEKTSNVLDRTRSILAR